MPDKNSRIKIKDVFTHPWVVEFEKEIAFNSKDSLDLSTPENLSSISVNQNCNSSSKIPRPYSRNDPNKLNKNQAGPKLDRDLKPNLLYSANKPSISTAADDLSPFYEEQSDNLFDKVLIQVKEKNKGNHFN